MAYTTLQDAKRYISADMGTADDQLLTSLIDAAKGMIDAHCSRTFEAPADTTRRVSLVETYDTDSRLLMLADDLCQITTVVNGDGVTIAPESYLTAPPDTPPFWGIQLRRSANVQWAYTNDPDDAVTITGRWAYSISAPADIAHVCRRLVAYLYKQRDNLDTLDRPTVAADGMMLMPGKLPSDVMQILAPYRKRVP